MVESTIRFQRRFRFVSSGATVAVTRGDLLGVLVMAADATSAYPLPSAVRVISLEVFGSPPGTGSINTSSVQWNSQLGDEKLYSDVGLGSAYGAHFKCTPPPKSTAGFWSSVNGDSAEILFTLTTAANDIVDVTLEMRLQNGDVPLPYPITIVGATVGVVYLLPLDFATDTTSSTLIPVSYATLL